MERAGGTAGIILRGAGLRVRPAGARTEARRYVPGRAAYRLDVEGS